MKGSLSLAFCAVLVFPILASASDKERCYLRDAASSGKTAYLLCEQGLVYGTTDAGATWTSHDTGASVILHGVALFDDTHAFVVGDEGALLATEDGGKTWQPRTTGTKENLLTAFTIGNQAWIAGFDGALLHSTDSGRTWAPQKSGTTMALQDLCFIDADHGWAVGWSGTILRTVNGGNTWETIKTDAASWSLAAVQFFDAKNGWAAGFSGQLLRSNDGGATWQAQKLSSQSSLTSIEMDKSKRLWIAADDHFTVSQDGGANWKDVNPDDKVFVARLFPLGDSLCALTELGILRQTGNGMVWKHDDNFVPVGAKIGSSLSEPAPTTASTAK